MGTEDTEMERRVQEEPPEPAPAPAAEAAAAAGGGGGEKTAVADEKEAGEKKKVVGEVGDRDQVVAGVDSTQKDVAAPATMVTRLQTQAPTVQVQVMSRATGDGTPASTYQSTPTPQTALASLNSRVYTNKITLLLFTFHILVAGAAVVFFCYKAVEVFIDPVTHNHKARRERRILRYWLPPIEGASLLSIVLAFAWQKAVRLWPRFMVHFILWATFGITLAAGVLLLCFSLPATDGLAIVLILFSIGTGLYACWVSHRVAFTGKIFDRALRSAAKFQALNGPAYLMMGFGFVWISVWCVGVIGALNFYYPPLTILFLVLSLAWTAEVMRNVANLTVSRVIALYYLRGMQSSTKFSFQRATTINLGSACLGSLFVPSIEALRILARGLNLLEGEDEFMFSCAHCCLRVMNAVFRYGNSWAFVHIAAYGRGFVTASRSTWDLFERHRPQGALEQLVDSDITSSLCFLSGVSSGALATIFASSLTFATHKQYVATVSLIAFFVGYLMTRIGMALPHACVACYFVCYAENPTSRLFDNTIPERLNLISASRDVAVTTPRYPRRVSTA